MNFSDVSKSDNVRPRISLGLPVYNGAQFIRNAIDSILSQTFTDFELIISDNASTDSTHIICNEYVKKDRRIRYYRQEQNIGVQANFLFVLEKAKFEYFKWIAADDICAPDFLKKTLTVLESKKNLIGCISKIERFGPKYDALKIHPNDPIFRKWYKKIRLRLLTSLELVSFSGSFDKKIRIYMKKLIPIILYGLFRTDVIRKSVVDKLFINNDTAMVLNTLRHGDFEVIDEVLMYYYSGGMSSDSITKNSKIAYNNVFDKVFPLNPLNSWFLHELGFRRFLRNLDRLILINCVVEALLLNELVCILIRKLSSKQVSGSY